jgi:hypothetical protein
VAQNSMVTLLADWILISLSSKFSRECARMDRFEEWFEFE